MKKLRALAKKDMNLVNICDLIIEAKAQDLTAYATELLQQEINRGHQNMFEGEVKTLEVEGLKALAKFLVDEYLPWAKVKGCGLLSLVSQEMLYKKSFVPGKKKQQSRAKFFVGKDQNQVRSSYLKN